MSVSEIGIRQDIREPPWVTSSGDVNPENLDPLHWGTLLADGAKAAWLSDANKTNGTIQSAVVTPIVNCTRLGARMPKAVA
eukprot:1496610-Pyramimonas_sp.AAC.1